jgi:oxalate decarboxylase
MFKADRFMDLSLSDWLSHTPPALVDAHLNLGPEALKAIPREKEPVVPT